MQKRLLVFISSTFKDLQEERAAAVKAVLDAGHIPAGMEFFAAGSASQWKSIKIWIDACDALMLIVGGRYGSIHPESGKSYVELEYEYAQQQGKPLFALVLSEAARDSKAHHLGNAATDEHGKQLAAFRGRVLTRLSAIVSDTKDIQIEALKSLAHVASSGTAGWIAGKEVQRLENELAVLRAECDRLTEAQAQRDEHSFTVQQLETMLRAEGDSAYGNVLETLFDQAHRLHAGVFRDDGTLYEVTCPKLHFWGLVERYDSEDQAPWYRLNETGRRFAIVLKAEAAGIELPGIRTQSKS